MPTRWTADERLRLTDELSQLNGGDSAAFFDSHGLGRAYRSPGDKSSKKVKVGSALFAAEQRGDVDDILAAAVAYLAQMKPGTATGRPLPSIALPRPANPVQAGLLQMIWDWLILNRKWPTFADLDRRFDQQYGADIVDVAAEMPADLMSPSRLQSWDNDQEIKLTVAGAAACRDSSELIALFLEALHVATRLEANPPEGPATQPTLTADALRLPNSDALLPPGRDDDNLARLGHLLGAEFWGWTGFGWGDNEKDRPTWSFTIGREVRRLRQVESLDDYWNVIHRPSAAASQPGLIVPSPPEVLVSIPEPVRASPRAGYVLTTEAVRWGIHTLAAQKLHPTFVMYLYLRVQQRAGRLATASAMSDELLKLITMPGNPTKPYYFPLIDRGRRIPGKLLPTFWRAENISGSWSPGSIRRLQGGGWLGADASAYAFPADHADLARRQMLYNNPVSALAVAAYFLRNDGFVLSGDPGADDLIAAFRSKFDYPEDAEDEFTKLFVTDVPTDVEFAWFGQPDTAGSPVPDWWIASV